MATRLLTLGVCLLGVACSEGTDSVPLGGSSGTAGAVASGGNAGAAGSGAGVGATGTIAPVGGAGTAGTAAGGTATGGTTPGGGTAMGGTAMGGAAGSGGTGTGNPCVDGPWTCIDLDPNEPYGVRTFDVPAQQSWVNTGLYLHEGEQAKLTESGTWQLEDTGDGIDHGPCKIGDFVARIGLYYKDKQLTCVHGSATFTAPKDGILYVGALAENDLGETYEARAKAEGKKVATVESQSSIVPTVLATEAASYDFASIESGWLEVWGKHVILTLPVASAKKDAAVMQRATDRLDAIYELEAELRSAVPHHGQRIRFFPDGSNPGYMLAGNPVRMQQTLVSGGDQTRISRSGEPGTDIWGFAHEMGHDFSFAPHGFWTYQENTLESWCNLFSIYSLEHLGVPLNDSTTDCTAQSTGDYASWDAWGGLCFLRQFQFKYGWDFYKKYFEQIKDTTSDGGDPWAFVYQQFKQASGQDPKPTFDAWHVPH